MSYLGEPEVRREITQMLAWQGLTPDDLLLEDLIALLQPTDQD